MLPIGIDGVSFYGVLTRDGVGIRLRLTIDEVEQLGLLAGRQLRIETSTSSGVFLLAGTEDVPPFVWLRLLPLAALAVG